MTDRVVVFLDWQNVYKGAREAFCGYGAPHWEGQVHPLALGQLIAADSPYDRQLHQVRVYRGQPDAPRDPKGYAASARQVAAWRQSPMVDVTMAMVATHDDYALLTKQRQQPPVHAAADGPGRPG
jgi:hypothetical protein